LSLLDIFRRRKPDTVAERLKISRPQFKTLSPDGLQIVNYPSSWSSLTRANLMGSYAHIYASQYNVHTAIDVIAREAATLHMHVFEKIPRPGELPDGIVHLDDHPVHTLMARPAPGMSQFRFWYSLFSDIAIYDIAYWVKVRQRGLPAALVRVPPALLFPIREPITQRVLGFRDNQGREIALRDLVVFWGYDPSLNQGAISPMESLRRLILEDAYASADREGRWTNSARKDGIIERDVNAKDMTDAGKESFLIDVEDSLAGPTGSGRPMVLEPGMHWNDVQWSPREMEYMDARRLGRTEVAAYFHIPPSLMAAAANGAEPNAESTKLFYQSTLPPWLYRVEREIEAQLIPDFELTVPRQRAVYVEFNLDEKLRGSFEERIGILATAAGGPIITVNEARAREGLPPIDGGDLIFVPLNSIRAGGPQGSPGAPVDTPAAGPGTIAGETPGGGTVGQASLADVRAGNAVVLGAKEVAAVLSPEATSVEEVLSGFEAHNEAREHEAKQRVILARHEERIRGVIAKTFDRQMRAGTFKIDRWNRELGDDLFGALLQAAEALADEKWDIALAPAIREVANTKAALINEYTDSHHNEEGVFNGERPIEAARDLTGWVADWVNTLFFTAAPA